MKYYPEMENFGGKYSFNERIGEPEEFDAAIGRIALAFSLLEQKVANAIHIILGTDSSVTFILTAQISFRQRLDMLGSVARHRIPEYHSAADRREQAVEQLEEVLTLCRKAEELRNTGLQQNLWVVSGSGS